MTDSATSFEAAIRAFVARLARERNLSGETCRAYASDLRQFAAFLGAEVEPEQVRGEHVRAFLASRHGSHHPSSLARELASLRAFFRELRRTGELESDPTAGVRAPRQPRKLPNPLGVDDCHTLMERDRVPAAVPPGGRRAARDRERGLRDRALVELLYGAGLRVGELVALDRGDLDLRAREVRVVGKGR
jgi:site-specific recombinase XerC